MGTQTRSANIELLRIFAIIGVIVLHYKNPTFGGGMAYVVKGSLNYYILIMLESIFVCAVDLFVLFLQLKIRNVFASRVINRMAEAVFSVFLLHQMFLPFIGIKRFVNADPLIMCVHIIGSAIVIYLLCWCAHVIYHIFVNPLIKRISDKNALMIVDLSGSN